MEKLSQHDLVFLDIGSGKPERKPPNWWHLDIRRLPGVDFVADARKLPFPDNSWDGITARDVIEHLPWRDISDTLLEWLRVLKPGGWIEIQTPDAMQLADILDNRNHLSTRSSNEPDWMYFNRVAYGHQDYPENTHCSYFKQEWLISLMEEAGFKNIESISADVPMSFVLRGYK